MKPMAKFGDLPFNVGGISVFAAVDSNKQAITEQLFIIGERSTRIFDLINEDTTKIYTFMQMVSTDVNHKQLPLSASAVEIQQALGKNQFVVKVFDLSTGDVLGYAYKFFPNKIVLSNGIELDVIDYNEQTILPIIHVDSISLNKESGAGIPGTTETLVATVLPNDASNKNVSWSSSSSSATVDQDGLVTFVSNGSATITATTIDGGKTASCIYVITTPVSSVGLNKSTGTGLVGATDQLTATVLPSSATVKTVNWTTSSASVATVSSTGLVTFIGNGTATITATTVSGSKTASCSYTVTTPVSSVEMTPTSIELAVNGEQQLSVNIIPANASNTNVSYVSSAPVIATVSMDGLVTGRSAGDAIITVTTADGAKTASTTVTVS